MLSMFSFKLAQCLMIMWSRDITCHCRFDRQTPRLVFTELTQEVAWQLEHQLAACSGEEQLQQLVGVAWISLGLGCYKAVFFLVGGSGPGYWGIRLITGKTHPRSGEKCARHSKTFPKSTAFWMQPLCGAWRMTCLAPGVVGELHTLRLDSMHVIQYDVIDVMYLCLIHMTWCVIIS